MSGTREELIQQLDWQGLQEGIAACQACELHAARQNTVFGVGSRDADLVFIGEAPGANEDAQGEPFVGRAGKLLDSMTEAMGLCREDVFILNILKCRPPKNRDPREEEIALCTPFLDRQLALLKPKLLVCLGRIAAQYLLRTDMALAKLRGNEWSYGADNIPVIATYHPAYLLRSPTKKRISWQDLVYIRQRLDVHRS